MTISAMPQPINIIMYEYASLADNARYEDVLGRYFRDWRCTVLNDLMVRISRCAGISADAFGVEIGEQTIADAYLAVERIYDAAIQAKSDWIDPLISPNDEHQVVFEWWSGDRKLTVRIGPDSVEAIKRWGPRPNKLREEINLDSDLDRRQTWVWLTT